MLVFAIFSFFTIGTFSFNLEAKTCPYMATFERSTEDIRSEIKQRSGEMPSLSCGGGPEYKVCHSCVDRLSESQWARVKPMLSQKSFRTWHFEWHMQETREVRGTRGESFLLFHRELIRSVQANLAAMGLPCLKLWTELPSKPDDSTWPTRDEVLIAESRERCVGVPKNLIAKVVSFNSALEPKEAELLFNFQNEERAITSDRDLTLEERWDALDEIRDNLSSERAKLKSNLLKTWRISENDLAFLECSEERLSGPERILQVLKRAIYETERGIQSRQISSSVPPFRSLESLGRIINNEWHGYLHEAYRDDFPESCHFGTVDPECDNMMSAWSTHVNIHFYQVHGLIDSFVDKWLSVNGYQTVAKDCSGLEKCYQHAGGVYMGSVPDFVSGAGCSLDEVSSSAGDQISSPDDESNRTTIDN